MNIALNLPINRLSFGQVSTLILRTLFERELAGEKHNVFLFPISNIDLSAQGKNEQFEQWLREKIANGMENYDRLIPSFKLWHLNGSLESYSSKPNLFTFYELDSPTKPELNIALNNRLFFSSKYSCEVFENAGVSANYLPLAFDSYNFKVEEKKVNFNDDRITFNLLGKWEKRKHHEKVLRAWIKKFGKNPRYALQCAVFNPFLNEEQNKACLINALKGDKPFNVNFYPMMQENNVYNAFLNSADIVIGMSGGEGWGLPEFQSVALGKHAVLLNAHAYKSWATDDMVTWVNPLPEKIPAEDGLFFQKGAPFNQGSIYDWNEDEFIAACETAVSKATRSKVNEAGLTLQTSHSKEVFVDSVIKILNP